MPQDTDDLLNRSIDGQKVSLEGAPVNFSAKQFENVVPVRTYGRDYYFGTYRQLELFEYCNYPNFAKIYYSYGALWTDTLYIPMLSSENLAKSYPEFKGRVLELYERGSANSPIGTIEYQRFLTSGGLACFDFHHKHWYKNLNRPISIGGYYCNSENKNLNQDDINNLLDGLNVYFDTPKLQ